MVEPIDVAALMIKRKLGYVLTSETTKAMRAKWPKYSKRVFLVGFTCCVKRKDLRHSNMASNMATVELFSKQGVPLVEVRLAANSFAALSLPIRITRRQWPLRGRSYPNSKVGLVIYENKES